MLTMPETAIELGTRVVLATFRANGRLLAAGDALGADQGLTAARWQVVGALALADRALTVPQIARRMGLTRQSVHATVNRLRADGLVEQATNADHRRSPLIRLTGSGDAAFRAMQQRQRAWIERLLAGLDPAALETAARVLDELSRRLAGHTEEESDGE
jgi:DNA-binding MarR family transcriptional regulator